MKYITLIIGLLVVGCGQSDIERLEEENKRLKAELENNKLNAELESKQLKSDLEAKNKKLKDDLEAKNKKLKDDLLRADDLIRASVVGEYGDVNTFKQVFLENGVWESYVNGKKREETTWLIVGGQIHVNHQDWNGSGATKRYLRVWVHRINKDKSITLIAIINSLTGRSSKRTDIPKERQIRTLKKIK